MHPMRLISSIDSLRLTEIDEYCVNVLTHCFHASTKSQYEVSGSVGCSFA